MTSSGPTNQLIDYLPETSDGDALIEAFLDFVNDREINLYEAQEEAILELLDGNNVILNTPTGSGKSLVATAAHFAALANDRISVYTAPIKALVSEKFFDLRHQFGADNVGMITGDTSVNPDAPIICCTAEILANWALRDGAEAAVDVVIADEFHYYADPQRGWAWQLPLLELPHCQFLLMSATLGETKFFETDLTKRTGRTTALVSSNIRPVPLEFEYRRTTLHQSISDLLEAGRAPIYLVHFTQREATEAAQNYLSLDPLTKEEKTQVKRAIHDFRFDSPIGKDIRRYLSGGVGIHHAGLLPKYRLLVEKLAQQGLLKIICGTDTLGIGVNIPIRTVLFTQLCKYDGQRNRQLRRREFKQIAGRAGRKGFDDQGFVWAQAPAHVVENEVAAAKAATDPKKKKKLVKKKPPERGYTHWDDKTFTKLIEGDPEPLVSSFRVNHQMILSLLDRPGDGCGAVKHLLTNNHEPDRRRRKHIKRSIAIYRSLLDAELLERLDEPDDQGRMIRVMLDLQDEFALHQPLSLWAVEAVGQVSDDDPERGLSVLSIIESILDSPGAIIHAQLNKAKDELMAEMKANGVEYEERMERLEKVEPPKPNKEWIYDSFDNFRGGHPWLVDENVKPKGIARDAYERALTFREYIEFYKLKQTEGVLLRYLSDVYKAMVQNIPEEDKDDELLDVMAWLGELVRQVDSSLIDEWDNLAGVGDSSAEIAQENERKRRITENNRAFAVMVRNELFSWVKQLARRKTSGFALPEDEQTSFEESFTNYWDEFDSIDDGPAARSSELFSYDNKTGFATQTLLDPDDSGSWQIQMSVDIEASNEQGKVVVQQRRLIQL